MGNLLGKSKSKKVRDKNLPEEERQTSSAPARLEGLDGTAPGSPTVAHSTGSFREDASPEPFRKSPTRFGREAGGLPAVASDNVPTLPALPQAAPRSGVRSATQGSFQDSGGIDENISPERQRPAKKIDFVGQQTDGSKLAQDLPKVEIQYPEEMKPWLPIFGEKVVRGLMSSDWKGREEGISNLTKQLEDSQFVQKKDPVLVWKYSCEMLSKVLRDKVAPIFFAGLSCFTALVSSYAPILSTKQLQSGSDHIVPLLIHRCGNLNSRIQESSLQAILHMTSSSKFGCAYIGPFALAPLPKKSQGAGATGQLLGRLDLMYHLLITFRSTQGLPVEDVLQFCRQALEAADEKVRQAAVKVIAEIYRLRRMAGDELPIERYLPNLKPAVMQVLERRFQEVNEELAQNGVGGLSDISAVQGVKIYAKQLPPLPGGGPSVDSPGGGKLGAPSPWGTRQRTPNRSRLGPTGGDDGPPPSTPPPPRPRMGFAPRPPSARPMSARLNPNPNFGKSSQHGNTSTGMAFTVGEEDTESTRITASPSRGRKKPATPPTPQSPAYAKVLDDAEEQLIEYILDTSTDHVARPV